MTTTPRNPRIKSLPATPNTPHAANPTAARMTGGEPKGVAEGVPVAVRPDRQVGDGRRVVGFLRISAPGRNARPAAESFCSCGRHETARGQARVLALIDDHAAHRATCPIQTEGRTAA
ncbi:hypothetical protein [Streptomyces sp. 2R]|uniref:hypothetical protein n=1 Tax=Streptomyces sp. 2R TaxID=1883452 RepID=UPI000B9F2C3E|nr:hypothetical protein [Streptomyces sp. 2R]OXY97813.1 hypothetical protein BEH93_32545 [Streptomyces sp. 2R]